MSWTYGGDLATSKRDLVRFLLGDTTQQKYSPEDQVVDYYIGLDTDPSTGEVNAYKAASEIARAMANKFSTLTVAETRIGTLMVKYDFPTMAQQYYALADKLLAGRTSIAEGGPVWDNSAPSIFGIGMTDNPQANGGYVFDGGLGL